MSDPTNESLERLRERVIEQLSSGFSQDLLNEHEFEERLSTATNAVAHAELRALLVDLPVAGAPDAPVPLGERSAVGQRGYVMNPGSAPSEASVIAVFSGSDRKGVWDPPKQLNVVSIFGGSDIDLRNARLPVGGMTITAVSFFGGTEIIVPEGVNVHVSGIGLFGAFEGATRFDDPIPGAPTIKVEGAAIFGAVEVKTKKKK